jgi:hypothetical protein
MADSQKPRTLSTLAPEIRSIILDHVFSGRIILFEEPHYQLASRRWSLAFFRTSRQLHTEGQAALSRAFRCTTIKYRNCMPMWPGRGEDYRIHDDFARKYGSLFESLEILRLPRGHLDLAFFPNLKLLTIGHFKHQIWSPNLPKMIFPRFSDLLDQGLLEAWDAVCQRVRDNRLRYPIEEYVIDAVDGKTAKGERSFKLYVRIVVEAQTPGVCR